MTKPAAGHHHPNRVAGDASLLHLSKQLTELGFPAQLESVPSRQQI